MTVVIGVLKYSMNHNKYRVTALLCCLLLVSCYITGCAKVKTVTTHELLDHLKHNLSNDTIDASVYYSMDANLLSSNSEDKSSYPISLDLRLTTQMDNKTNSHCTGTSKVKAFTKDSNETSFEYYIYNGQIYSHTTPDGKWSKKNSLGIYDLSEFTNLTVKNLKQSNITLKNGVLVLEATLPSDVAPKVLGPSSNQSNLSDLSQILPDDTYLIATFDPQSLNVKSIKYYCDPINNTKFGDINKYEFGIDFKSVGSDLQISLPEDVVNQSNDNAGVTSTK